MQWITHLLVVLQAVLVLVRLLAANDWTLERLVFLVWELIQANYWPAQASNQLSFPHLLLQLAVHRYLAVLDRISELLRVHAASLAEQSLGWLVDRHVVQIVGQTEAERVEIQVILHTHLVALHLHAANSAHTIHAVHTVHTIHVHAVHVHT